MQKMWLPCKLNLENIMGSKIAEKPPGYLEGQLLIATPFLAGGCFMRSVVYIFAHDDDGAMGLVINHIFDNLKYSQIFNQLNISPTTPFPEDRPVHFGGPVECERGFILHTKEGLDHDYFTNHHNSVLKRNNEIILSSNVDILKNIAAGKGPKHSLFALGYAGWDPGQLEQEIAMNSWILVPASPELIFDPQPSSKWLGTAESFGIDLHKLTPHVGHA